MRTGLAPASPLTHGKLGAGWGRCRALPENSVQQGAPGGSETKWAGSSLFFLPSQYLLSSSHRFWGLPWWLSG